jgi:predicted permease
MAERIAAVGGVRGVSYSRAAVMSRDSGEMLAFQRSDDPNPPAARTEARWNQVETSFFGVYGMPLVLGRGFTAADRTGGAAIVVVNQTFAAQYFPQENPVGRHLSVGRGRNARDVEIVGVVRDFRQKDLRSEVPPALYTAVASASRPFREAHFVVRTGAAPETLVVAIRRAVAEINPHVPLANLRTQAEQIEWTVAEERMIERLATFLGVAALALASIGLYGLLAYGVARRTGEIGLRIALGALPAQVRGAILRDALMLAGIGVGVGLVAAVAATRLVASQLYGLSPTDPLTLGGGMGLLLGVAALAALVPARRAAKVDPMVALRSE